MRKGRLIFAWAGRVRELTHRKIITSFLFIVVSSRASQKAAYSSANEARQCLAEETQCAGNHTGQPEIGIIALQRDRCRI
jgi:hypothetical protein